MGNAMCLDCAEAGGLCGSCGVAEVVARAKAEAQAAYHRTHRIGMDAVMRKAQAAHDRCYRAMMKEGRPRA